MMNRINLRNFMEVDPARKDYDWASLLVTQIRRYWQPLVSAHAYRTNMAILNSDYDTRITQRLFKTPTEAGVSFVPIAVMEKLVNQLIAESENSGIHVSLTASDPTATNQRQKDRELIANRRLIETTMNHLSEMAGLPPFSLKAKKGPEGKPLFNGNADTFDNLGLDDSNDEDLNYFFSIFYRLRHEIKAESPIRAYLKLNEVAENIGLYIRDILAIKAVASHTYVNEVTGSIDVKYVCPADVRVLPGKRRDYKDAQGMGKESNVTVAEFIRQIGNEFDYKNDMPLLLQAANTANSTDYAGVWDGELFYFGESQAYNKWCLYSDFMEMQVGLGYIEWKSFDAEAYKVAEQNKVGNFAMYPIDLGKEVSEKSVYVKETWYNELTYKAYYLIVSAERTRLFKFGKLCMMPVEGANDEYSAFSLAIYREKGKPAVKVCEPYIEMIQKAWVKFEHLVARAKPPGRAYSYDSLVRIAEHMFAEMCENNMEGAIDRVLKLFHEGENEIYTYPMTDDGKLVGGGGQSSFEIKNGLSDSVKEFMGVLAYCFSEIDDKLGISKLRDGSPDPRESYKAQDAATQSSMNATQYIRSMMISMINNVAKRILSYVQDIIRFGDKATLPYKFMLTLLGDEVMQDLELLKEVSAHRYGLFVEAVNTASQKLLVMQRAQQAMENKYITYEQLLLIESMESPKEAAKVLAYERKRTERKAIEAQAKQDEQAQKLETIRQQGLVAKEAKTGDWHVAVADKTGEWNFKIAQFNKNGDIQKQDMKNQNTLHSIDAKSEAKQKEAETASDTASQASMVA